MSPCQFFFGYFFFAPLFIIEAGALTLVTLEAGTAFVIFFFITFSWFWNVACVLLLLALSRLT